jgi:hypothetical protein
LRKFIGGFRIVYKYACRMVTRTHRVKATNSLMLFDKEMELKDGLKIFSPSMVGFVPGIIELEWFHVSLRE